MTRGAVLSAVLLVAASAPAFADSDYPDTPPPDDPAPDPTFAPPSAVMPVVVGPVYVVAPDQEPKSPMTAGMLSFFTTVVPPLIAAAVYGDDEGPDQNEDAMLAIMLGSVIIGPSIGHLYAGKVLTPGLGVRVLGLALSSAALGGDNNGIGLLLVGTGCIVGGAIADIATAGRSARQYNWDHAKRIMPTMVPVVGANGQTSGMQVGLAGSF